MTTFISVGNSEFNFDRLINSIKKNLKLLPKPIIYQFGFSSEINLNVNELYQYKFMSLSKYYETLNNSKIFISHLGAGSLLNAKKYKINSFFLARKRIFKEHIDDHQMELFEYLRKYKKKTNIFSEEEDLIKYLFSNLRLIKDKSNNKTSDLSKIVQKLFS